MLVTFFLIHIKSHLHDSQHKNYYYIPGVLLSKDYKN